MLRLRLYAEQIAVEPSVDRCHHRGVVGVHGVAREIFPALPYRGGTLAEHESPAGVSCLRHDLPGIVHIAVVGEHIQHIFGAEVAGGQMVALVTDIGHEIGHRPFRLSFIGNSQIEGKGVAGLIVGGVSTHILTPVGSVECLARLFRVSLVLRRHIGHILYCGHLADELLAEIEIAGGHQQAGGVAGHAAAIGIHQIVPRRAPVTVITVLNNAVLSAGAQVIGPFAHPLEIVGDCVKVAVELI